ncbi:MAG: CidA/LrgA family protein [Bradymonadia bacterium]
MITALALLLLFQLAGEAVSTLTGLPVPGPVIGMALLTIALRQGWISVERLRPAAAPLLEHMTFLFVPPGVGISLYFADIARQPVAILTSMLVSTALVMAVVGLLHQRFGKVRP